MKSNTLIKLKVQESARYFVGKSDGFDLRSPAPVLEGVGYEPVKVEDSGSFGL